MKTGKEKGTPKYGVPVGNYATINDKWMSESLREHSFTAPRRA